MRLTILFVAILGMSSCATTSDKPVTSARLVADWDSQPAGEAWSQITLSALRTNGEALSGSTPIDVEQYCPNYGNLGISEREAFWLALVSRMARYESSFNPDATYEEGFKDGNGDPVISRGLLQISIESANGSLYRCNIQEATDLQNPETNLNCGVRILNALVSRDNMIGLKQGNRWQGGAAYWSVLRTSSGSNSKIRSYTSGLEVCSAS